ncbi:MAG: type II secretion system F family protein [Planctomycetota bacterium]|nr:type II secretion system F family protein [Planctomycetota bacterium]
MAKIQRRVAPQARPSARPPSSPDGEAMRVRRKVPLKHITRFTRMLATLTEAGLPVLRNLRILADQWPSGRFQDAILDSADMVEEGQPLSDALSQNPDVFDELYVNMVRAGEAGGVLDTVLNRLADFQERAQELKDQAKSAMTYPMVIFFVAVVVVGGLMGFVIPKFKSLYEEMGLVLPKLTQVLISLSEVFVEYWYLFTGVPTVFIVVYQMMYYRSLGFRRWNHQLILRVPVVGGLVKQSQVSRFATTFGTLVSSGVPHLQAFDIVRGALSNEIYREAVEEIREEVREGEAIASALESTECFDDVMVSMVEVGEETGELDRMCLRVGAAYEEQFKRALDIGLKLIEPLMLVFMALVVGVIAMALFLPLFDLLKQFGQAA